ncbi:hypothetical protein F4781DRAFT_444887 [Annulohypoxylon bovei var. microspora]|nr:hypothetical protein F4781DRAFT_444887 [Annulohypoxylon bovei var. microspora]
MDFTHDLRLSGDLPYSNLIRIFTDEHPESYFMEPPMAAGEVNGTGLRRIKPNNEIEVNMKYRYKAFGSLSHTYRMPLPGKGGRYLVFYRCDRGTMDHGLAHNDEELFECSKYNILRHPRECAYNNPNYGVTDPGRVSGVDKDLLNLANYPFFSRAVMSAPLLPRCVPLSTSQSDGLARVEGQFSIPRRPQPSALTRVFGMPELCIRIMTDLGHRWGDLSNLSRTCQMMMYSMNEVTTRVDMTHGNFLNLNLSDRDIEEADTRADPEIFRTQGHACRPGFPAFLMFSSIRGRYVGAEDGEGRQNYHGYPAAPKGSYYKPTYEDRMINTYKLLSAMNIRGSSMKVVHFHSVPNLDLRVLRMCLEQLPNLEVLGVHNCELLHFGKTISLLRDIIAHNKTQGNTIVRSDFSPVYYHGLQRESDGRKGEYGVIPSDKGGIETRRAIAAVLFTAVPLALNHNIDWFSPGTGMRGFLDRIPWSLGSLRYVLEALYNLHYYKIRKYTPMWTRNEMGDFAVFAELDMLESVMLQTLHQDLILAIHGKAMDHKALCDTMMLQGKFILMTCAFCSAQLPSFFFTRESASRPQFRKECCGCELRTYLKIHVDNFFQEKKKAAKLLFRGFRLTDVDAFLNKKRYATDDEISDREFPFWESAARSREDVQAANSANGSALVLDERPPPTQPKDMKEIWFWKERLASARRYARVEIDQKDTQLREIITAGRQKIRQLDFTYDYLSLKNDIQKNRDEKESICEYLDEKLVQCGLGQEGRFGIAAAADWDSAIEDYRQTVQALCGVTMDSGSCDTVWSSYPNDFFSMYAPTL